MNTQTLRRRATQAALMTGFALAVTTPFAAGAALAAAPVSGVVTVAEGWKFVANYADNDSCQVDRAVLEAYGYRSFCAPGTSARFDLYAWY